MTSSKISSAPCALRELAQRGEELAPLQQQAVVGRHRLDDDGGDARAFAREQCPRSGSSSSSGSTRVQAVKASGTPAEDGPAEGGEAGAGGHQQVIRVAVVAAGELHDQVAAGEGARHADGAHDRLGARGNEAHLLRGRVGAPPRARRAATSASHGRTEGRAALQAPRSPRRPPPGARALRSAGPRSPPGRGNRGRPRRTSARPRRAR